MKLRLIAALMLAAMAPGARLAAQRITPFVGGGGVKGSGDLSKDTGNGWLVFGGLDVPLGATPGLSLGATGSYAHIPYSGPFKEATNVSAAFAEINYRIGGVTRTIAPYLRAGVGALLQKYDPGTIKTRSTSETTAGLSGGAGLDVDLWPVTLLLGARVVRSKSTGFLSVQGGLAWHAGSAALPTASRGAVR